MPSFFGKQKAGRAAEPGNRKMHALERVEKADLEANTQSDYEHSSHNELLIDARNLVLPIGKTLADYLTAEHQELLSSFASDEFRGAHPGNKRRVLTVFDR